ncbi:MAG: DarT ssDNA thymidine ADP-ribosyltransferase family protein [Promethearchaeota archaeon]
MVDIYHITHIDNLSNIMLAGGLKSDTLMHEEGNDYQSIGYQKIKSRWMMPKIRRNSCFTCIKLPL